MCVRCAKPHPLDSLNPVSHWLIKPQPSELVGDPTTALQPYCTLCKSLTWIELWARRTVLTAAAIAIVYGISVFKDSERGPVVHTEYAFLVAGIGLWLAITYVIRLPLHITPRRSKLRYRFRKGAVGNTFFQHNIPKH